MMQRLKIFYSILLILASFTLRAQEDKTDFLSQSIRENDISELLPPLAEILDAAEQNSPLLKVAESEIIIQQLRIKSEKKDWLSHFGVDGSVRYGLFDNLILKEALGVEDLATNTTSQTRYNIGIYFKIPFTEILNTTDEEIAESEKIRLIHERENTALELRKLVIVQYNNLIGAHKKLIIRTNAVESKRVQDLMVEKQFTKGQISIADYTRQKDFYISSKLELEDVKIEFMIALQILQETVGQKFNLKP